MSEQDAENRNAIERLIREAGESGLDTDVPVPEPGRQSFRIVGGSEAAQVTISVPVNSGIKKVAATSISSERYLAVPVRDVPVEGYSIEENGYDANTTRARIEALLGPGSHLDGPIWATAIKILDAGGKVLFTRSNVPVDLQGRQVFSVRIVE